MVWVGRTPTKDAPADPDDALLVVAEPSSEEVEDSKLIELVVVDSLREAVSVVEEELVLDDVTDETVAEELIDDDEVTADDIRADELDDEIKLEVEAAFADSKAEDVVATELKSGTTVDEDAEDDVAAAGICTEVAAKDVVGAEMILDEGKAPGRDSDAALD